MPGDSNFNNVSLLLHGNGANNGTSILDSSLNGRTPLSLGSVLTSTAQSKFNGSSLYFPQSTPLTYSSHATWNLTITNWTWELFFYELAGSGGSLLCRRISGGVNGWVLTVAGVRALINGAGFEGQQAWSWPSINTWHHLAWVKSGTNLMAFLDGVLVHTKTGVTSFYDSGGPLVLGQADQSSENRFKGYMAEIRWTPNVARYLSSFSVPLSAYPDGLAEISGTVYDDGGYPCSRIVRAYARDTGAKIGQVTSDPITGAYKLYTTRVTPSTVVFLDDDSGLVYNAIIKDRVNPV